MGRIAQKKQEVLNILALIEDHEKIEKLILEVHLNPSSSAHSLIGVLKHSINELQDLSAHSQMDWSQWLTLCQNSNQVESFSKTRSFIEFIDQFNEAGKNDSLESIFVKQFIYFLHRIVDFQDFNKMNSHNCSTIFNATLVNALGIRDFVHLNELPMLYSQFYSILNDLIDECPTEDIIYSLASQWKAHLDEHSNKYLITLIEKECQRLQGELLHVNLTLIQKREQIKNFNLLEVEKIEVLEPDEQVDKHFRQSFKSCFSGAEKSEGVHRARTSKSRRRSRSLNTLSERSINPYHLSKALSVPSSQFDTKINKQLNDLRKKALESKSNQKITLEEYKALEKIKVQLEKKIAKLKNWLNLWGVKSNFELNLGDRKMVTLYKPLMGRDHVPLMPGKMGIDPVTLMSSPLFKSYKS